ncbi:UNVERIFIED_CONTAM: hypothetical protein FKN15_012425 [Acipenser sinensis]
MDPRQPFPPHPKPLLQPQPPFQPPPQPQPPPQAPFSQRLILRPLSTTWPQLPPLPRLTNLLLPSDTTPSSHLRRLIIQGKDVNLISILIAASEYLNHRVVDCGDLSVTLKSRDPQLQKSLTLREFVIAFSAYHDVLCTAYPHRCQELGQYLLYVSELSVRYRGTIFYDYHKAFSAKTAAILEADNVIINWATPDMDIFN